MRLFHNHFPLQKGQAETGRIRPVVPYMTTECGLSSIFLMDEKHSWTSPVHFTLKKCAWNTYPILDSRKGD